MQSASSNGRAGRWSGSGAVRGSHRQFRHPDKPGTVTIAGKSGDDLPPGTWASVMKQAGLKK